MAFAQVCVTTGNQRKRVSSWAQGAPPPRRDRLVFTRFCERVFLTSSSQLKVDMSALNRAVFTLAWFLPPDTAMTITPAAKSSASVSVWSVWGSESADCAGQLLSLLISVSLKGRTGPAGVQHPYFCAEYSVCTALHLMLWGWLSTVRRTPRQQLESPVISQHKCCSSDSEVFVFAK